MTKLDSLINAVVEKEQGTVFQLERIASALETIAKMPPKPSVPPAKPSPPPLSASSDPDFIAKAKKLFSAEILNKATFQDTEDDIIIRLKDRLGTEQFQSTLAQVRSVNGRYEAQKTLEDGTIKRPYFVIKKVDLASK